MPVRKAASLTLLASAVAALFFLGYPNYVIRPKRPQGARELQLALATLHYQHSVELVCAGLALIALIWLIRSAPSRGARVRNMAGAAIVFLCAGLSFVNIYEIMFHPAGAPGFQPARASKLDGDEKVLAVNARAYPIRSISYHHIVNDTEDGVPIVVTY